MVNVSRTPAARQAGARHGRDERVLPFPEPALDAGSPEVEHLGWRRIACARSSLRERIPSFCVIGVSPEAPS